MQRLGDASMEPAVKVQSKRIPSQPAQSIVFENDIISSKDASGTEEADSGDRTPVSTASIDERTNRNDSNDSEDEHQPRVDTLYALHTWPEDGPIKTFYRDTPFAGVDFKLSGSNSREDESGGAIVCVIVPVESQELWDKEGNNVHNWWKKRSDLDAGGRMKLELTLPPYIKIGSQRLMTALKSIIDYDPGQPSSELGSHFITTTGCYSTLLLHYDDMYSIYTHHVQIVYDEAQRADAMDGIFDHEGNCVSVVWDEYARPAQRQGSWDEATCSELSVLLRLLGPHYNSKISPIARKLQLPQPLIEFENLWALYKPGTIVYKRDNDRIVALVVVRGVIIKRQPNATLAIDRVTRYELEAWFYEYDGSFLKRISTVSQIEQYEGDCSVMTLPLVPAKIYDRLDDGKGREHMRERGKKMLDITKSGFAHRDYDHPKSSYRGQIIIDPAVYNEKLAEAQRCKADRGWYDYYHSFDLELDEDFDKMTDMSKRAEPSDGHGYRRFSDRHEIDTTNPEQLGLLGPDGVMLIDSRVGGLALSTKKFMRFEVDGISSKPPWRPENQLENCLVAASEDDREILRTILDKTAARNPFQADFVRGKGEGQVFLLHGPPGTGKTLTAECIANDTRRPLISLKNSDIDAVHSAESSLRMWFNLAAKWGAILLIDEADVFLERRTAGGATHNYLVRVFLRTMEYYKGILFLTTNRPGQIDDSFISRITAAIQYPALTQEARNNIWQKFFTLHEKYGQTRVKVTSKAKKELRQDTTPLNGREIRNIFQNAINLANLPRKSSEDQSDNEPSSDAETGPKVTWVDWDHFSKVLERHKGFKEYLKSLNRNMDEHTRNAVRANY